MVRLLQRRRGDRARDRVEPGDVVDRLRAARDRLLGLAVAKGLGDFLVGEEAAEGVPGRDFVRVSLRGKSEVSVSLPRRESLTLRLRLREEAAGS